ncbi:MAG: type II CRISPR-associated endonuclease Cas1 [Gemmataceae bacterium]
MIKRVIEISKESVHFTVEKDQLLLIRHEPDDGVLGRVPCEDIGLVLVDHQETTYTHAALARLLDFGAAVVICGRNHLPAGLLLPLPAHTEVVWRIHEQINVSKPVRKQLWQQIVRAKIRAQARNLSSECPARGRLLAMADRVRSGDPDNMEAQAAKIYWSVWLSAAGDHSPAIPFQRAPQGSDGLNGLLNYGYAVLRAAVGRALVAGGLFPPLGLHHANRSNAFCLADDLLEPLRPLVDRVVRRLYHQGQTEVNPQTKKVLLELMTVTVRSGDQTGPLMVALHRTVASLVRCYRGEEKQLLLPEIIDEE